MVEIEHSSTVFRSIMEVTNMVISYYLGSTEGVSLSAVFIVETYHEEPHSA